MLTTQWYQPMGMISDRLKAQLAEMQARHAETDRKVAAMIAEAHEAFNEIAIAQGELEALLED